jgi:hypothetical protein
VRKFPSVVVLGFSIAGVVTSGCGSTSPTGPTTASLRGEWGGTTCAPSNIASCVIVLRLDQSGTAVSGTWARTTVGGPLTGTVSGRDVVLDLTFPSNPPSVSTMTLRVRGNVMSGSAGMGSVLLTRNP